MWLEFLILPGLICPVWYQVIGTAVGAYVIYWLIITFKARYEMKKLIWRKQKERELNLLNMSQVHKMDDEKRKILSYSDDDLIGKLQSRELKAIQVLHAFIARALEINLLHNCIIEFIPQAEDWARELDELKEVKGKFHGLPISIKDNCDVEGCDSTLGLAKKLFKPKTSSSVVVKSLRDLGAVPFCKTNVPQTLLSFGCVNPIFGLTSNYLNKDLGPGGSSGGEATLIAGGGSRFGVGSDIGGSVRIPAHFTGVASFKPTKERISSKGFEASMPNVVGIAGCPGFLSKSPKMLTSVFKELVRGNKQNNYDPMAMPIPWNDLFYAEKKTYRIGYYTSIPFFPPLGDAEEVTLEAVRLLRAKGHTCIEYQLPRDGTNMMNLVAQFGFADEGHHFNTLWESEPIPGPLLFNYLVCNIPGFLRRFVRRVLSSSWIPFIPRSKRGAILLSGETFTCLDLGTKLGERKQLLNEIFNEWKEMNLDFVISPAFPFPALPHKALGRLQIAAVYTMIYNLLDFPCGTVNFGKESGTKLKGFDTQGDFMLKIASEGIRSSVGMPISVQVIALPFQEEIVLRGMELLEGLRKN